MSDVTKLKEYQKTRVMDFFESIHLMPIDGVYTIDKFGEDPNVGNGDSGDVWDHGGFYVYTEKEGANYYFSSSDANDKQPIEFSILVVDADGNWIQEPPFTQNLNGQTKTLLVPPSGLKPVRLWRMENDANEDDGTDETGNINGVIHVYEDSAVSGGEPNDSTKVRGYLYDGNNQTLMGIKTIPYGYTGFLKKVQVGISRKGTVDCNFRYWSRRKGKVFKTKGSIATNSTGNGFYTSDRSFFDIVPGETDIRISYYDASAACGVYAMFDLIIVRNDLL